MKPLIPAIVDTSYFRIKVRQISSYLNVASFVKYSSQFSDQNRFSLPNYDSMLSSGFFDTTINSSLYKVIGSTIENLMKTV